MWYTLARIPVPIQRSILGGTERLQRFVLPTIGRVAVWLHASRPPVVKLFRLAPCWAGLFDDSPPATPLDTP